MTTPVAEMTTRTFDEIVDDLIATCDDPEKNAPFVREFAHAFSPPHIVYRKTEPREYLMNRVSLGAGECWYFTGPIGDVGYGRVPRRMGEIAAHRLSYRVFVGPIPDGLDVLHSCDVRSCINPDHLRVGTHQENMHDMAARGRAHKAGAKGTANAMAKLTEPRVEALRKLYAKGCSIGELSAVSGLSKVTVSRAVRGESWGHVG